MVMICLSALWILPGVLFLLLLLIQSLRLLRKSIRDPLTGLYNLRHLETLFVRCRNCRLVTVYYFDLDHLKQVNDTKGHDAGDRLLLDFADRLRSAGGSACRVGGDEFILIQHGAGAYAPADTDISVSWGRASGAGRELRRLILDAERQMYRNREARKG